MSREIQFASAAAELAWQDAGLAEATIQPERFGVMGAAGLLYCELEELHAPFVASSSSERSRRKNARRSSRASSSSRRSPKIA